MKIYHNSKYAKRESQGYGSNLVAVLCELKYVQMKEK